MRSPDKILVFNNNKKEILKTEDDSCLSEFEIGDEISFVKGGVGIQYKIVKRINRLVIENINEEDTEEILILELHLQPATNGE